jgi:hypothetical protein
MTKEKERRDREKKEKARRKREKREREKNSMGRYFRERRQCSLTPNLFCAIIEYIERENINKEELVLY